MSKQNRSIGNVGLIFSG